jgi:hypothetical protein
VCTKPISIYSPQINKYKPIKTKIMTLLLTPAILMGERKQGWTFKNKLIATVWFLAIDLFIAKASGVL